MKNKKQSTDDRYKKGCQAVIDDIYLAIHESGLVSALSTARAMTKNADPGDPVYDVCHDFVQRHNPV